MDGRMFEGAFIQIFWIGAVAGLAIAGLIWLIIWLCGHIRIEWVS